MAAGSFACLFIPVFLVAFFSLSAWSDYSPVWRDPLFALAMIALLVICLVTSAVIEFKTVKRDNALEDGKERCSSELARLAADVSFLDLYASQGKEGEEARARVAELADLAGGWPSDTTKRIFADIDGKRVEAAERHKLEPVNNELRDYLTSGYFEYAFFSSDDFVRNVCEKRLDEMLMQLGGFIEPDLKDQIDRAYEKRETGDSVQQEFAIRNESLNQSLKEIVDSAEYQHAVWDHDLKSMAAVLEKARPILEELGENADREMASKVSKLEHLWKTASAREKRTRHENEAILAQERSAREHMERERNQRENELAKANAERTRQAAELARLNTTRAQEAKELAEVYSERDRQKKELEKVLATKEALHGELISKTAAVEKAAKHTKELEKKVRELQQKSGIGTPTHEDIDREMAKLDAMDGWAFESYCADLFKAAGYQQVQVTSGSGDQGIDVIAIKNGIKYGIQCKNYSHPVGNKAVQEAYAGKSFHRCHIAVVLTNNTFLPSAVDLAQSTEVVLWDRNMLRKLVGRYLSVS
ncbi:hypothetical protein B5F74_02270 [Collinsella sp. An271]|nr:hypothetical protein B5F74_02270 [Collinsella sp. An271]